jgi:hypothetical protein
MSAALAIIRVNMQGCLRGGREKSLLRVYFTEGARTPAQTRRSASSWATWRGGRATAAKTATGTPLQTYCQYPVTSHPGSRDSSCNRTAEI